MYIMKKILTIAACVLAVACGTTTKSIKISGDLSQIDMIAEDSKVELRIEGNDETLALTSLNENKCFTADIAVEGEQFVLVYINDTAFLRLITEDKDITFNYSAENETIEYADECLNREMNIIKNDIYEKQIAVSVAEDEESSNLRYDELVEYIDATVVKNKDNILSLPTLKYYQYYGEDEARFVELFEMINPKYSHLALYKEYQQYIKNNKNTAIGANLVDIALEDGNGNVVRVSELCQSGKWVLVDFWATWCGPCRGEIPHLVDAYAEYAPKGLEIYGISFDRNGDTAKWQKFIADNKMTWVNVWGTAEDGSWSAGEAYNVSSIPTNFLFSPEGKLVAKNLRGENIKVVLAEHIK